MKSYDVVGWTYDGEIYCADCKPAVPFDEQSEVSPVFADQANEGDNSPDVCGVCGELLLDES